MSLCNSPRARRYWTALLLSLLLIGALSTFSPRLLSAQTPGGTIAYVRLNNATGDQIRLIAPDGSDDRLLWSTGVADPLDVYSMDRLVWRPDGTELAFVSSHENACSIDSADIYAVGVDGQGYRRVTQAPACAALASFPKGTVEVPVTNGSGESFTGFVYFQGAPGVLMASLPPGGSTVLTFANVADFGDGELQLASMIVGSTRDINIGTAVDVIAGGTVRTGTMNLYEPYNIDWQAHAPAWRHSSDKVGFVLNFASLRKIDPNPAPLDFGEDLLAVDQSQLPDFINYLAWGPTDATAQQLLYSGNVSFETDGIYRASEGDTTAGKLLISYPAPNRILGLAWLPDGSGFVYAVTQFDDMYQLQSSNLFEYSFATGKATQLTRFDGEFAGQLTVSPDGRQIVFERSTSMPEFGDTLNDPDLWLMQRDGTGLRLLVQNGRSPAWGSPQQQPAPGPAPTPDPNLPERAFLPLLRRSN